MFRLEFSINCQSTGYSNISRANTLPESICIPYRIWSMAQDSVLFCWGGGSLVALPLKSSSLLSGIARTIHWSTFLQLAWVLFSENLYIWLLNKRIWPVKSIPLTYNFKVILFQKFWNIYIRWQMLKFNYFTLPLPFSFWIIPC